MANIGPTPASPQSTNTQGALPSQGNNLFIVPPEKQHPAGPPVHPDAFQSTAIPPPGAPPQLTPHGGAVLDQAVYVPIYLGDYWNTPPGQADAQATDAFAGEFGTSPMKDVVSEYGVKAASFGGSTVVPGKAPVTFNTAALVKVVQQAIASGAVKSTPQGIYTVFLPPGTILDGGNGATSQQGLGGFHGSYQGPDGKPVYYAVICYSEGQNGINFDGKPQDGLAITASHEWTEAQTDPDVNSPIPGRGLGWYDDTDNAEIGDLAVSQLHLNQTFQQDAKGHMQQLEWSNHDNAFEIAPSQAPVGGSNNGNGGSPTGA